MFDFYNKWSGWKFPVILFAFLNFIFLTVTPAAAQDTLTTPPKKLSLLGVPIIYVSPESGFSFGLGGFLNYRANPLDQITKPANVSVVALFSTKGNYQVDIGSEYYTYQNRRIFKLDLKYKFQPEDFYGIGYHRIPVEPYDITTISAEFSFYQQVEVLNLLKKFYLGPRIDLKHIDISLFNPDEIAPVLGEEGGFISGLGFLVNYDSRDNIYYPLQGSYLELNNFFYQSLWGSEYTFNSYVLDLRHFIETFPEHVIAMQLYADLNFGYVPFHQMGMLGGSKRLRGIYEGRFRDNHALILQGEYRFPVIWRIGLVAFGGVGRVADDLIDVVNPEIDKWIPAGGLGLRGTFNRKEHVNLRLDVGYSRYDNLSFYVTIKEAF